MMNIAKDMFIGDGKIYQWQEDMHRKLSKQAKTRTASEIEEIAFNSGRRYGKTTYRNEFQKEFDRLYIADFFKYLQELPMKISEVRKGQQVEFYDSHYSGGPHLGEVVEVIKDEVVVNFAYKGEVEQVHLNAGQLKLMKQAFTLQEEIQKMITDVETRLHATIDKKISQLSTRDEHRQSLMIEYANTYQQRTRNQMTEQFQVLDKRMVEEIGKGIERIDYLNKHAESMEKELEAAQKNIEHYKQQFIASELERKELEKEVEALDTDLAEINLKFYNFKNNSISNFKGYCLTAVAIGFALAFFLK